MRHSATCLAALAGYAVAFPAMDLSERQVDANPWIPNPPGSVRGPCPGLNTLANHGFINRDGTNITGHALQQGFLDAFNMGFDATAAGAQNALNLCGSHFSNTPNDPCSSFDLPMLSVPHQIEHDASLTRNDAEMSWNHNADNHDFNETVWQETLVAYSVAPNINYSMANTARQLRIGEAKMQDAAGWFIEADGGPGAEFGFTLSTMNDPEVAPVGSANYPQARVAWVNYWFVNERLPTAVGWHKPAASVDNAVIGSMANAVFHAPTYAVPQSTSSSHSSSHTTTSHSASSSSSLSMKKPTSGMHHTNSTLSKTMKSSMTNSSMMTTSTSESKSAGYSVTKAAASSATGKAPAPPTIPNPYQQVLPPSGWSSLKDECTKYVLVVEEIFVTIIESFGYSYSAPAAPPAEEGSGSGYKAGSGSEGGSGPVTVYKTVTKTKTVAPEGSSCY